MHAIAVDRARARIGQIAVPDLVGEFRQLDALDFALAVVVEKAELDLGGVGGKQREVDPEPGPCRAAREGHTLAQACVAHNLQRRVVNASLPRLA